MGHKSWNQDEIIEILMKTGTFTCPVLPHYRYDRVKRVCNDLRNAGFLKRSGKTSVSVNLVVTDRFKEWKAEYENGDTRMMPIKWRKKKYPTKGALKEHLRQMMQ